MRTHEFRPEPPKAGVESQKHSVAEEPPGKRLTAYLAAARGTDLPDKRWVGYLLAAGAGVVVTAQAAQAGIVYTPANFTFTTPFGQLNLDLNHDGIADFNLMALYLSGIDSLTVKPASAAAGEVYSAGGRFAAALSRPNLIGPRDKFGTYLIMAQVVSGSRASGPWIGANNLYLGLRFDIDGVAHYGWARFTVKDKVSFPGALGATLTGYAYNTTPNEPIAPGQTTPEPGTLGLLALGTLGLGLWRVGHVAGGKLNEGGASDG